MVYKIAMGWLLGAIFFFYYEQGDTIQYFSDACQLVELAYQRPLHYLEILGGTRVPPDSLALEQQPRAFFFTKLVSLVNLFTNNNYWITSAYFSLLSFSGSWRLANCIAAHCPPQKYAAGIAFLFYPSVVFWGSGILKESVAVAAIAMIVRLVLSLQTKDGRKLPWNMLLLGGLAIWVLWRVKYYYAAVLFPTTIAIVVSQALLRNSRGMLFLFGISWLTMVLGATLLHPVLSLDHLVEILVYNHDVIVRLSDTANVIQFDHLTADVSSLMRNAPLAAVSGLFRPLLGDGHILLQWAVGLENTALLLAALGAIVNVRSVKLGATNRLWVTATVVYTLVLATLLAWASPNFGSLMRYKVAFLPFLVYLCLAGNLRTFGWIAKKLGKAFQKLKVPNRERTES